MKISSTAIITKVMQDIFLKLKFNQPFLSQIMKIEEFKKRIPNLHGKTEYAMHIRNLKHALNHG